MNELKEMLNYRGYNKNVINAAIERAEKMERQVALERVIKEKNDRVVLAIKHHPAIPSLTGIIRKHWTTMVKEKRLLEIFPKPPMVAYQQHPNLKMMLVKAKLPSGKENRVVCGMKKCNRQCKVCSYVQEVKEIKSNRNGDKFQLKGEFNCQTKGVVYMTFCLRCGKQYVGQTKRKFSDRIREHWLSISNKKDTANAEHFNSERHNIDDFRALIIEKVMPNSNSFLLEREEKWIRQLETKEPHGLNRNS